MPILVNCTYVEISRLLNNVCFEQIHIIINLGADREFCFEFWELQEYVPEFPDYFSDQILRRALNICNVPSA
jgi:hypothetical protein